MDINIKTGANITRLLQSTVTIPQAYTELVKNSIQNGATHCEIALNKRSTVIIDNGNGFDHERDDKGKNDFDKYFVYGNSYTTNTDETTSLGQMGIGGKLSNDRLTDPDNPWWTIETKNIHGKCFLMTYKPEDLYEFLDDYKPTVEELDPRDCNIATTTGSRIIIHNLDPEITYSGWPHEDIRRELASFFGLLVYDLLKQGKQFTLHLDNEPINFAYELPGINIPSFTTNFNYKDIDGLEKSAPVRFQMSMIEDWDELEGHPLSSLSIISFVKVSDFYLTGPKKIDTAMERVNEKMVEESQLVITREHVTRIADKLIGFISCRELTTVLDRNGMPAKDLSHHTLRADHPVTQPFLEHVYYTIVKWAMEYYTSTNAQMTSTIDALSKEISALVAEQFDNDGLDLDIYTADEGLVEELADDDEDGMVDSPEDERLRESVKGTVEQQQQQDSMIEEPKNMYDIPKNDWTQKLVRKNKKSRYIPYLLMDFGHSDQYMMSRLDSFHKFRVLINTGNPKYKFYDERQTPELITMYISELLIKEVLFKKEGKYIKSDVDQKISEFYDNYLEKIRARIVKTLS